MMYSRTHCRHTMFVFREICDLNNRQPGTLVRRLYTDLPAGDDYLRGYKCPGHFSREPLRYFRQYFPKTRLIVGLRHPVRWFERYVVVRLLAVDPRLCLNFSRSTLSGIFQLLQLSYSTSSWRYHASSGTLTWEMRTRVAGCVHGSS